MAIMSTIYRSNAIINPANRSNHFVMIRALDSWRKQVRTLFSAPQPKPTLENRYGWEISPASECPYPNWVEEMDVILKPGDITISCHNIWCKHPEHGLYRACAIGVEDLRAVQQFMGKYVDDEQTSKEYQLLWEADRKANYGWYISPTGEPSNLHTRRMDEGDSLMDTTRIGFPTLRESFDEQLQCGEIILSCGCLWYKHPDKGLKIDYHRPSPRRLAVLLQLLGNDVKGHEISEQYEWLSTRDEEAARERVNWLRSVCKNNLSDMEDSEVSHWFNTAVRNCERHWPNYNYGEYEEDVPDYSNWPSVWDLGRYLSEQERADLDRRYSYT